MSLLRLLSLASLCSVVLMACGADDGGGESDPVDPSGESPEQGYEDELVNAEKNGQASQKWIYAGPLPKLDKAEVVASLKSHTVRVTGSLPASYDPATAPFYAEVKKVGSINKLTVVYPIATGALDPSTGKAPSAEGSYNTLFGIAYTATTKSAPWGGFPFIMYNNKRGIAFHGPITSVVNVSTGDYEWNLLREPVSHGCNRMAGEHVVEMAHLLGMNMAVPHSSAERFTLGVRTVITPEFDTFDGKLVDVDYPAGKGVVRPTGPTAKIYPTWLSNDFPQSVCPYQADRPLGAGYCDSVGTNRRDLKTGKSLTPPSTTPWIGSTCDAPADCAFTTSKGAGECTLGAAGTGECTILCEGGCPDKAGAATTFCAAFSDGKGRCVAKAESLNAQCADLPGTTPTLVDRFIGKSTAKAAQATVCMPDGQGAAPTSAPPAP